MRPPRHTVKDLAHCFIEQSCSIKPAFIALDMYFIVHVNPKTNNQCEWTYFTFEGNTHNQTVQLPIFLLMLKLMLQMARHYHVSVLLLQSERESKMDVSD